MAKLCPEIYLEVWLDCLTKLGIFVDNPTWTKDSPEVELTDYPGTYSSLNLPGFNEEEYINQLAKKVDEEDTVEKGAELGGGKQLEGIRVKTSIPSHNVLFCTFFLVLNGFVKNFSFLARLCLERFLSKSGI